MCKCIPHQRTLQNYQRASIHETIEKQEEKEGERQSTIYNSRSGEGVKGDITWEREIHNRRTVGGKKKIERNV